MKVPDKNFKYQYNKEMVLTEVLYIKLPVPPPFFNQEKGAFLS